MVRTLVTGATGTLGSALRSRLVEAGHTVRAGSRSPPDRTTTNVEWTRLDLVDGQGVRSALEDVDVVVHAATAPRGDTEAVDVAGTERLLDAASDAGVENFLYPSIVGIDGIPYSYYEHKQSAETAVEESDCPTTILRATQFHSFVAALLHSFERLPVWPLPTRMQVQPVAVDEVAAALVERVTGETTGRVEPVGGPEVHSVGELARAYRRARGLRRPILGVPLPGETAAAFRAGDATCPEHAVGTVTWSEWLAEQYTDGTESTIRREQSTR